MADEQGFDPTQYGATAVAEPFDPTQHGAIPVQPPEEPSILQKTGRAVVDTLKGFLPQSVSDVALAPINMIPGFGQAVKPLENIAFGRPISEGVSPLAGIPVVQRIPQIIQAEKTPSLSQERFTTGAGVVADLAMLAGFKSALHPELAEVAGIPKPEVAPETVTPTPSEPVATDAAAATPIVPEAAQPVVAPEVVPSAKPTVENLVSQVEAMPTSRWAGYDFTPEQKAEILAREAASVPAAESVSTAPLSLETASLGKVEPVAPDLTTGTGVAFNLQADVPRPEPQVPSTFSVQMPTDAFGTEQTPVASALQEMGGVLSKSGAKKAGKLEGNSALWDDVQPLSHPTHNKIYSLTGETPDVAAQTLHDAGLISDPSPTTMWKAVADESKSSRNILKSQQGEIETQKFKLQETSKQAQDFGKAQKEGWKSGEPVVPVRDLQVGDHVTVKDEKLKVIDIDPDSFDVTLEDGRKFGVQTVKDNTVLYGEHETPLVAPKLLSGEIQGDLISSTQKEPFALVGEKGTDFAAQQAAAEKATTERAQSEKGQTDLFKPTEGGIENAQQIPTPTQPNGDVLNATRPEESISEVPANVGSEGVPQGGQGETLPAAQEQVVPPTSVSDDQHISMIANRFTEERTKSGELGEIAPGQGYSTKELADAGLKMTPEQINQHVSDLMNGTGDPIEQGKAVRAEEARLSQRSNDLSRAASNDPTNIEARTAADNAFKDVTDFHNGPVAKLKTIFHATGVGLQGELPVDLSTFNGLREKFLRDTGKPPTQEQEPQLEKMAEKVSNSVKEDNGAKQNLGQAIDKATARRKLPTYDEVRQNIADRMKLEPCRV